MKTPHITLTRLKKSIERDEVQWVSNALIHAQQDVVNEATSFAYLNNHFACFGMLAQKMSIENSYRLIKLTCEYHDLAYFKILMTLPQQPRTLERMICYAARENFFEGFSWGVETFHAHIEGTSIMVEALQSGPQYVDAAYLHFAHFSEESLKRVEPLGDKSNRSHERLAVVESSRERLKALMTHNILVNTIGMTPYQRERKI